MTICFQMVVMWMVTVLYIDIEITNDNESRLWW